ncbi:MAG: hypothetical protein U1D33_04540, partial [bacterium]|nr:hypothetical protein [bacterium]
EFINLVRSGKFTSYILSTDSLVVNFSDDVELIRIMKELKSRLDKGEALIDLTGFAQVGGKAWDVLKSGQASGDGKPLGMLLASGLANGAKHFRYGDGHVVQITANAGKLSKTNDTERESIKSDLENLIEGIRPKSNHLNAGQVVDTTLTFINSGDQPVFLNVKEVYPSGGTIETADTKGEVSVETRNYQLTVPALDKVSVDYLYRMPFEMTTQKLTAEIIAKWKSGISDKVILETPYIIEKDLDTLMASISLPVKSESEKKTGKSVVSFSTSVAKEDMIDGVLGVIDNTARDAREAQLNLDQAVEQVELAQVASANNASGDQSGANEPSTFNGPTASFVKGNCSLNTNAKSDWSWLMWMGFILLLPFVRGGLRWGRPRSRDCFVALLLAMTITTNVHATDTGLMGFDRQLFQPAADQTGIYNVVGTAIPKELKPRVGFVTNFGKDTTTVVVPATGREVQILDYFTAADLLLATGYWDHWSVGVALPVYFYLNGTNFNSLQSFTAATIGDLRLDLKYRITKEGKNFPALAFFSRFTFPTGSQANWTGDRGVTWEYRLVADKQWGDFQVFANAGFLLRRDVVVLSSRFSDAFTFGGGGRYHLPWQRKSWA